MNLNGGRNFQKGKVVAGVQSWRVEACAEEEFRSLDLDSWGERKIKTFSLVLTPLFCLSPDNIFECTD